MAPTDETACKTAAVEKAQARHKDVGQPTSRKPRAHFLVGTAYLFGGGGMLAWLIFLFSGPPAWLDIGLGNAGRLLLDTLLCLFFFLQHSVMVRREFRLGLTRILHANFHGSLYATASGMGLLLLTVLWQPVGSAWWAPEGAIRWFFMLVFLAAGIGAWWGSRALGDFDALGVKSALAAIRPTKARTTTPFRVRGPYRWVRHPLYFFSLIIIWSGPVFTADRLLHNVLWTVWIVIATTFEERDLVDCFGDAYRQYQKTVPMLLPTRLKPHKPTRDARP